MNELLKMSKGNKKLKKTLIFDLPSGHTCPMANECKSYVVMNANGKNSLKEGENTIFRCFAASQENQYPNVYKARKYNLDLILKSLKGEYGEVYVGAWRNADGTYVFDASVRIDNLDQALYIAKSGNQDAIFDLSKFDTIDTGTGYEQLKTDKLFSDDKAIQQVGKTSEIEREFIGTRSKIQTEGAI